MTSQTITLCGSATFEPHFYEWNKLLSLSGHVVFSPSCFVNWQGPNDLDRPDWYDYDEKQMLDVVHKSKIVKSDAIVVLNVGGYIGRSTATEVLTAYERGKVVYMLEPTIEMDVLDPKILLTEQVKERFLCAVQ